jgi:hypothetical protein
MNRYQPSCLPKPWGYFTALPQPRLAQVPRRRCMIGVFIVFHRAVVTYTCR